MKHCLAISKGTTLLQLFPLVAFFLWSPTNAFTVRPPVTDSHYTSNQILMSSINQYYCRTPAYQYLYQYQYIINTSNQIFMSSINQYLELLLNDDSNWTPVSCNSIHFTKQLSKIPFVCFCKNSSIYTSLKAVFYCVKAH